MTHIHRESCRLCDHRRLDLVVRMEPIPLSDRFADTPEAARSLERFPIDLYMCQSCSHVQQLDVIDSMSLWDGYTYESAKAPGMLEHFREVAAEVIGTYRPAEGSLVVDIGSNDGSLLQPFKDAGYRVLGVDPAKEIAARASARGIETIPDFMTPDLARMICRTEQPSVVLAFNAFAHADDMSGMVKAIKSLLAHDGVFVFEAQYLLDVIDKALVATIFHEHMSHHSVRPLIRFLELNGLELIHVKRYEIQHGSIIGVVQHAGGPRAIHRSVSEIVQLEDERRLDDPRTLEDFGARIEAMRSLTKSAIGRWKGKTIAAYGAARSAPTLIAQLGLGGTLECVFDDHPQKLGRYLPGEGLEVRPTRELYERMPDYTVILAWVHADKIISENVAYLQRGGKFITLTPPRVYGRLYEANL
jgi:2-polyprenyl-3-methyl-5-hydroxy-6-metoxy-1,4-benzoquinol methylase